MASRNISIVTHRTITRSEKCSAELPVRPCDGHAARRSAPLELYFFGFSPAALWLSVPLRKLFLRRHAGARPWPETVLGVRPAESADERAAAAQEEVEEVEAACGAGERDESEIEAGEGSKG